jgi:hypothetical protein
MLTSVEEALSTSTDITDALIEGKVLRELLRNLRALLLADLGLQFFGPIIEGAGIVFCVFPQCSQPGKHMTSMH